MFVEPIGVTWKGAIKDELVEGNDVTDESKLKNYGFVKKLEENNNSIKDIPFNKNL